MRGGWRATVVALVLVAGCGGGGEAAPTTTAAPAAEAPDLYYVRMTGDGETVARLERRTGDGTTEPVPGTEDQQAWSPDVSPDGSALVYDVDDEGDGLWVLDLEGGAPRRLPDSQGLACPRWFPDGRRVAATTGGTVEVLDLATGERRSVRIPGGKAEVGCPDPLGDREVVVAVRAAGEEWRPEVWRIDVERRSTRPLGSVPERCIANDVAVDPTETMVLATAICDDLGDNGLYLLEVATGASRRLVGDNRPGADFDEAHQYWAPEWSADGATVVFHRATGPPRVPASVWSLDVATGRQRELVGPRSSEPVLASG